MNFIVSVCRHVYKKKGKQKANPKSPLYDDSRATAWHFCMNQPELQDVGVDHYHLVNYKHYLYIVLAWK